MERLYALLLSAMFLLCLGLTYRATAADLEGAIIAGDVAKIEQIIAENPASVTAKYHNGRSPLFFAKTAEVVNLLIAKGADIEARDENGLTPLIFAASGNDQVVEALLAHGANINACDKRGRTALHVAAQCKLSTITVLVEKGANVNIRDKTGVTPILLTASGRGNIPGLEYLAAHGADIRDKNNNGAGALHLAAEGYYNWGIPVRRPTDQPVKPEEKPNIIAYLLTQQLDVNAPDNNGQTPLHYATKATYGRLEDIVLLLEHGADPNALDKSKQTPLSLLLTRDSNNTDRAAVPQIATLLIAKGAQPGKVDNIMQIIDRATANGNDVMRLTAGIIAGKCDINQRDSAVGRNWSPLFYAARGNNEQSVRELVERGADVRARDHYGATPLHYAYSPVIYEYLVAKGADPQAVTDKGETLLHMAARTCNTEMVAYLLEHGVNIDVRDKDGRTPLMIALPLIDAGVVELLIAKGADIKATTNDGGTLLHLNSSTKWATTLLERGLDVNARSNHGVTPLHIAVSNSRIDLVNLYLQHGANINAADADGATPLFYARDSKVTALLLASGADVTIKANDGSTPVHWAAASGSGQNIIPFLAAKGFDVNARDAKGLSPLHWVSKQWGSRQTAEALLKAGADINAKSNDGLTPTRAAILAKWNDLATYLRQQGGIE